MGDVTVILDAIQRGEPWATESLFPMVYDELRRLAAIRLSHEAPGQTLQATALVHEAWLRLGGDQSRPWNSRGHFLSAAAEAMRRILIDRARRKNRVRHGRGLTRVELDQVDLACQAEEDILLRVDEALEKLAVEDAPKAELIKLRYFAGFTISEAGRALGLSEATAKRHWAYARAWLLRELTGPE